MNSEEHDASHLWLQLITKKEKKKDAYSVLPRRTGRQEHADGNISRRMTTAVALF